MDHEIRQCRASADHVSSVCDKCHAIDPALRSNNLWGIGGEPAYAVGCSYVFRAWMSQPLTAATVKARM